MYNQIFGSFSDNDNDPSSRISQANSCIALDPYTGCSLGCAYCYRHNSKRDDNSFIPTRIFKDEEIVASLLSNPYFIPNKTVIGMGIASTDSFLPQVRESSFGIMKLLSNKGLKNPFWFVLKSGVPKDSYNNFKSIIDNGNKIIISVTYSGMPKEIEPFTGNRFANLKEAISAGVDVSLHLRPIVYGWNDNREKLQEVILEGINNGCTSICIGGLRYLDGVEKAIVEKYKINFPEVEKSDLIKTLPSQVDNVVRDILVANGIEVPLFFHSSEVISHYLRIPDYNLSRYRKENCLLEIPEEEIASIENKKGKNIEQLIRESLNELRINTEVNKDGNKFFLQDKLNYKEERGLIHRLGLDKFV